MPGRNRKNRGPGRNDSQRARTYDAAPNNHLRPPRPVGPTSQDSPRRRSHVPTHTPSSGIHRPNDNSNPGLSSRFRNLKQQSDVVKRELEDLISQIDELQPDAAAMDWSGSAGTIVYVPLPCAPNGSFQHAQMKSISTGEYPHGVATFLPYPETTHAGANDENRADAPVTSTPYAESMRERRRSGATTPSASRCSTAVPGDRDVRASVVRPAAASAGMFDLRIPPQLRGMGVGSVRGGQQHDSTYATPDVSYREGGGCVGIARSNANVDGQRANHARSTTVTSPWTPPPSPVEERGPVR